MPRQITERLIERDDRHIVVAIDPHDGDCRGQHDIIIEASKFPSFDEPDKFMAHVSYTWQASAILSHNGTKEFRDGMNKALKRGEELKKELMDADTKQPTT